VALAAWPAEPVDPFFNANSPEDIAEAVRFLLRTSPACIVPEIQFIRAGDVQHKT